LTEQDADVYNTSQLRLTANFLEIPPRVYLKYMETLKKIFRPIGRVLKPVYQVWMKIAHVIGTINTTLILTLFYFVLLGIAKLGICIGRKDLLDSRWKDCPTYWKKREDFSVNRAAFLKPY